MESGSEADLRVGEESGVERVEESATEQEGLPTEHAEDTEREANEEERILQKATLRLRSGQAKGTKVEAEEKNCLSDEREP